MYKDLFKEAMKSKNPKEFGHRLAFSPGSFDYPRDAWSKHDKEYQKKLR